MKVLGHEAQVMVNYKKQSAELPLVIVDDEGSPLFGQNWVQCHHKLDWKSIKIVSTGQDKFLGKYQTLFMEELTVSLLTSKKQFPCFVRLNQHSIYTMRGLGLPTMDKST